jgi:hypothetical protein
MTVRSLSFELGLVLSAVTGSVLFAPAASAKRKPSPPPRSSTSSTYVRTYADVLDAAKCDVTPAVVRATPRRRLGRSRIVELPKRELGGEVRRSGTPQWQKELFAVRTDDAGLVGACGQIHPATPLDAIDPGLATVAPALPVQAQAAAQGDLPGRTQSTSIGSAGGHC